ncbi:All-trans-nonaprenyl-diphosphate synthase (geranyl-diphosphate specific) (plasmid) [Streptomyces sp. YIM 121038]|nr:All-trans-nonaprenyl-diphosphate synthase (geranyl-diphosphate specific) [Streptomyces sp. YIM 121038]
MAGGKRLRPLLCVTGWYAAAGQVPVPEPVVRVAAALELFHAFCLIHDDVMDNSPTRRGRPTVHRTLADRHPPDCCTLQTARKFGTGAAILIGDLALTWSDELVHTAGLTPGQLAMLLPLLDVMRTEVMYGQYLDLAATGHPTTDLDHALTIIRYKTAKYTIERPVHIGAALAGGTTALAEALTAYALPLGEAFQLRDDLLGVYGDIQITGKSPLDDLRDGKHTVLLAIALRAAAPHQAETLERLLGRPDLIETQAGEIRSILTATGARAQVEEMINLRCEHVKDLLNHADLIHPCALPALWHFANAAARRSA